MWPSTSCFTAKAESVPSIPRGLTHRLAVARERFVDVARGARRHRARQVRQLLQVVGVAAEMN